MRPMLADAIDMPIVMGIGLAILIPVMAFQVVVEAYVLGKFVSRSWRDLCSLTFRANCWSLVAGIPTKICNMMIYGLLLPRDIPGFVKWYPLVTTLGITIYFLVTLLVEACVAVRRLPRESLHPSDGMIWRGMLVANLATYALLAPVYYTLTKPSTPIPEFTRTPSWSLYQGKPVVFLEDQSKHLKVHFIGQDESKVIIPQEVRDYLVSADLNFCLFRGTNGHLQYFNAKGSNTTEVWRTEERFLMNQVAFSPSGRFVAYLSDGENSLSVVDTQSQARDRVVLPFDIDSFAVLAWTTNESVIVVRKFGADAPHSITLGDGLKLGLWRRLTGDSPELLECYGLVSSGRWSSGDDWGASFREDKCMDLSSFVVPGLGSALLVSQGEGTNSQRRLVLAINPGMLHLSAFYFHDATFLPGCKELVFSANEFIYLLEIETKQAVLLSKGSRFVVFTERYRKRL